MDFTKKSSLHTIHVNDMLRDFNILIILLKGSSSLLKIHLNFIDNRSNIIAGLHKKIKNKNKGSRSHFLVRIFCYQNFANYICAALLIQVLAIIHT